ncbi:MAG: methyl-accepting chemotaxis protein, partial [bacterium]
MSISKKLLIPLILLTLIFTITSTFFFYQNIYTTQEMTAEIKNSSVTIRKVYKQAILPLMKLVEAISLDPLLGPEPKALNSILFKLRKHPALQSAFFVGPDELILGDGLNQDDVTLLGKPIPKKYQLKLKIRTPIFKVKGEQLIYSFPFVDQGEYVGRLQAIFSLKGIRKIELSLLEKANKISVKNTKKNVVFTLISGIFILISLFLSMFMIRKITQNLALAVQVSKQVSEGMLDTEIEISSNDETGDLLLSMQSMITNIREVVTGVTASSQKLMQTSNALISILKKLISGSKTINTKITTIATSSHEISNNISIVSDSASAGVKNVAIISSSANDLSTNVTTVAIATEEARSNMVGINSNINKITDSITDVAEDVDAISIELNKVSETTQKTAHLSEQVRTSAGHSLSTMEDLRVSTQEIDNVLRLISNVTRQTNMLSLNATIEAASAGESGKGFAVVAGEVKSLAQETANATNSIEKKMTQIQEHTISALNEMKNVDYLIADLSTQNQLTNESIKKQNDSAKKITQKANQVVEVSKNSMLNIKEAVVGLDEITRVSNQVSGLAKESAESVAGIEVSENKIAKSTLDVASSLYSV